MIVFHTDLDSTLIYSYRHDIGKDKFCVEIYKGKEISFITPETYRLLQEVQSKTLVIPTTTRTVEQYERIQLRQNNFKYVLACNGGILLRDGKEDIDWYEESLSLIEQSADELQKAMSILENDERRNFELRFVQELFVFTKCAEPEKVTADLKKALNTNLVDVFSHGSKVYVIPKALSKGKAIERFRSRFNVDYVVSAGDSEFDLSMLEASDFGIATIELAHIILSRSTKGNSIRDKVTCPCTNKLYSEVVLETVLEVLHYMIGTNVCQA